MKNEIMIGLVSIFLVLGLSFFIFNFQGSNLTGFAVYNESSEDFVSSNESLNEKVVITKEHASLAIEEAESIISEMQENNFSTLYMNDTLIQAKKIFEQAKYAEILRNVNASEAKKQEARKALTLVNWKDISFDDVLVYTNEIKNRREEAFLLIDKIAVEESKINPEEGELYSEGLFSPPDEEISEETKQILEDAKMAFREDRYQDVENLLEEFRNVLELETTEASTLSGIKKGAKNFFQRYWIHLIIALILLSVIGYFAYKKFEKKLIRRKIKKMKAEKEVLVKLMKKAQEERFKKNIISGLVYNIRMKKYQEKLQEIKQELPVLEARLDKLSKIYKDKKLKKEYKRR